MNQIELCARNVSAAVRETWNAINAANEVSWHDASAEEEENLKMSLSRAVNELEAAQEILSRRQRGGSTPK